MTTDCHRLLFTHHHEELDGHDKLPWPRGQCSAALSGRVIGPANRRCQRLSSTKLHIESENLEQHRSPFISGRCAVLEPHSCDVLAERNLNRRGSKQPTARPSSGDRRSISGVTPKFPSCTTKNLEQTTRSRMPDRAEATSNRTARQATGTDHVHDLGSTRSDIIVILDDHRRHRRH